MAEIREVLVPDIGDFADVPVIEVLVSPGDTVAPEDPLVTLESDKATMDVPAPFGGTVAEIRVSVGDTVSEGSPILALQVRSNGAQPESQKIPESQSTMQLPSSRTPAQNGANGRSATAGGSLGDALRNLQRYTQNEAFDNQGGGGGQFGPEIQFDTKGVEFGPWIRRFIAQVKRNWLIPYAAMSMKGHVAIQFNVHKDGSITDLQVVGASAVDAFNNAALGALSGSNPTQPLPPEYPDSKAFFTVTFFYNETPPR